MLTTLRFRLDRLAAGESGKVTESKHRLSALWALLLLAVAAPAVWFAGPAGALALPLLLIAWLATGGYRTKTLSTLPYAAPLFFFLLVQPLGISRVVDWTVAWPKLACLALGLLALAVIATVGGRPNSFAITVCLTIIGLGGGIALIALVGTDWPEEKWLPFDSIYEHLPRLISGIVPGQPAGRIHPNEVAGVLTPMVPLAWAGLLATFVPSGLSRQGPLTGPAGRALLAAAALLVTAVVVLTESRSAYAGLAIAPLILLGWWLARRDRSPRARALGLAGLLAGILAAGWLLLRLIASWPRTAGVGMHSLPERFEIWRGGVEILAAQPVTGVGPGQFSSVLFSTFRLQSNPETTYVPHAHNFFLQIGLDYGVFGFAAFLLLLIGYFGSLRTAGQAGDRGVSLICVGLALGLVSFLIYGLTDALALGARGAITFWVVLGLGAAAVRCVASDRSPAR